MFFFPVCGLYIFHHIALYSIALCQRSDIVTYIVHFVFWNEKRIVCVYTM